MPKHMKKTVEINGEDVVIEKARSSELFFAIDELITNELDFVCDEDATEDFRAMLAVLQNRFNKLERKAKRLDRLQKNGKTNR